VSLLIIHISLCYFLLVKFLLPKKSNRILFFNIVSDTELPHAVSSSLSSTRYTRNSPLWFIPICHMVSSTYSVFIIYILASKPEFRPISDLNLNVSKLRFTTEWILIQAKHKVKCQFFDQYIPQYFSHILTYSRLV
jgi:hypothetical protein